MESSHLLLEKPGPQADLTLRKLLTVLAPLADIDNISVASPILTLLVSMLRLNYDRLHQFSIIYNILDTIALYTLYP